MPVGCQALEKSFFSELLTLLYIFVSFANMFTYFSDKTQREKHTNVPLNIMAKKKHPHFSEYCDVMRGSLQSQLVRPAEASSF